MIVIAVGQSKGGVGKTTLAVNVAGELSHYGKTVTLIDADPQGSALQWSEPRRLTFPVRQELLANRGQLVWVRNVLKSPSDLVILDLPAGFGQLFETAVLIADLLIVPCGPSSLDLGAAQKTILRAKEVRRVDLMNGFKIVTVPTRVDVSTEEGAQIADALGDLGEPVAPGLSFDMDFVRSFTSGSTVFDLGRSENAAEEIRELSNFLLRQTLRRSE